MNQQTDQTTPQTKNQAPSEHPIEQPIQENPPPVQREPHGPYDPRLAGDVAFSMSRHRAFSTGDMAEMRRMDPDRPIPHPFWKLMLRHGVTAPGNNEPERPKLEKTWARIVRAIAVDTKVGEKETTGPHQGKRNLGHALAQAGYREERLKALLNARDDTLMRAVEHAAHFLSGKGEKFNWNQCAALMMTPHRRQEQRDGDRMRIARDYYRAANSP